MKIERTLGEGLVAFREDLRMSRKEFYEKAGITQSRLSQLENDLYSDPDKTIKAILSKFNKQYSVFLRDYCGLHVVESEVDEIILKSVSLTEINNAIRTLNKIKEILEAQK